MRYAVGDIIETRYFWPGSHGNSEIKRGIIVQVTEDHYHIDFEDGYNPKRLGIKTVERLSRKFDPGSGPPRKFKFLS
mgnify:CR=1 FL=1|tara:strand:- start:1590 stop:1820 length:231 start_codon:yes stop_codon:yes gene_type:complete